MEKHIPNDKALHLIFEKMNQESLPADFQRQVMQKIAKVQKQQERKELLIVSVVALGISIGALYILIHDLSFSFTGLYKTIFEKTGSFAPSNLGFYTLIGLATVILLTGDYYLRRSLQKRGTSFGGTKETT